MIKDFVALWDQNRYKLYNWFKKSHPDGYEDIVARLVADVLKINNPGVHTVYAGGAQGPAIFLIVKDPCDFTELPDILWTWIDYGSCSSCDTLERIRVYDTDVPSELQIADYMTLALHLLQRMKYLVEPKEEDND